jgi:alkanesulfonate monooxygenase SsuD/methylene tetrahydromethanopterin reductase-like flavin-dependent oxidoreductase (luciferase family)
METRAGGEMKVGIFDHVEFAERPLATTFKERLQFVKAADEAGFWGYHVAEHHGSPLNMVPVPGAWLGAVAQATKNIHLGPLVYLLPLYSPLRLAEEISILDHLSEGRLEVGVGRGVSPFEMGFHNIDHDKSRDIFMEAYDCLVATLTTDKLNFSSERYKYNQVPVPLHPLQKPYPAFWYASSNTVGSTWAGEQGMHFVSNGPTTRAKTNIDAFREALARRGAPAQPKAEFKGGVAIGVSRQIVVADTEAEARRIAEPNSLLHHANLTWIMRNHAHEGNVAQRLNVPLAASYEDALKEGTVIAGTPDQVRAEIERQVEALGINYLIAYPFFGNMQLDEALRSLHLFSSEVMPKIAHL